MAIGNYNASSVSNYLAFNEVKGLVSDAVSKINEFVKRPEMAGVINLENAEKIGASFAKYLEGGDKVPIARNMKVFSSLGMENTDAVMRDVEQARKLVENGVMPPKIQSHEVRGGSTAFMVSEFQPEAVSKDNNISGANYGYLQPPTAGVQSSNVQTLA